MCSDERRLAEAGRNDRGSWVEGAWYRPEEVRADRVDSPAQSVRQLLGFPVASIMDQAEELIITKAEDYGYNNVARSPFGPLFGLLTRMHDKQARAVNLVSSGHQANHEGLEDTFLDMIGIATLALLCIRGQWPGVRAGKW